MLGIIIGVMAVVLVMSVGAGAQSLIVDQVKSRGTDLIAVLAGASEEDGPPAQAMGIVITTLTRSDMDALLNKNNVRHIEEAAAYVSGNDIIRWQQNERNVTYTGTMPAYATIERAVMERGRFFDKVEEASGDHVIVLGATIADEIFGNQDPIGENVKLAGKNFTVIGVVAPIGPSVFEDPDTTVMIPLSVAQNELLGVRYVSFIRMKVAGEEYLRETIEEVKQTLIERHGEEDFSVRNIADAVVILETITGALAFFLVAVASISLFVGGVGIMNIMLISVKEKTREIGLRKAVGATQNDILKQFLVESVLLTLVGGVIGTGIGITISFGLAKGIQSAGYAYSFIVDPISILLALVVAGGVGLVFGLVPARKAAKLNSIDALRYE